MHFLKTEIWLKCKYFTDVHETKGTVLDIYSEH